jgi:hypothetical protein
MAKAKKNFAQEGNVNFLDDDVAVYVNSNLGLSFVQALLNKEKTIVGVIQTPDQRVHFLSHGVKNILELDTLESLPRRIGKMFIFEHSFAKCCEIISQARKYTTGEVFVITTPGNPTSVLKLLGADYVVFSRGTNVDFLIG